MQRTAAAIGLFQRNNLALMLEEPLNRRWTVGPGQTPEHQTLAGLSDELDYDSSPMDGDAPDLARLIVERRPNKAKAKPVALFIPFCEKASTAPR